MSRVLVSNFVSLNLVGAFEAFLSDNDGSISLLRTMASRADIEPVNYLYITIWGDYLVTCEPLTPSQIEHTHIRVKIIAPIFRPGTSANTVNEKLVSQSNALIRSVYRAINEFKKTYSEQLPL